MDKMKQPRTYLILICSLIGSTNMQGQDHYCTRLLEDRISILDGYKETIDCLLNDLEWSTARMICADAELYIDELLLEVGLPVDTTSDIDRHRYNLLKLERADIGVMRATSFRYQGMNESLIRCLTNTLNQDVHAIFYPDYEMRNWMIEEMIDDGLVESRTTFMLNYSGKDGNVKLHELLQSRGYYSKSFEEFDRQYPPNSIESIAGTMRRDDTLTGVHRLLSQAYYDLGDFEMAFIHLRLALRSCSEDERVIIVKESIQIMWAMGLGCSDFWCQQAENVELSPSFEKVKKTCCGE